MLHLVEERLVCSLPFAGKNNQGLKKKSITKPSGSGSANWLLITLVSKIIRTSGKNLSLICTLWGKKILVQWEEALQV